MIRKGRNGEPNPQPLEARDLPAGVPGPPRPSASRDAQGRFLPGSGTAEVARKGAKARHEVLELQRLLGLWSCPEDHDWAPYARLARDWRDRYMQDLAETVGGGVVGPGPASLASTAALQLAASRWLLDRGAQAGDKEQLLAGSRLGDSSRQNVLSAHEIAAKEAKARVGPGGGGGRAHALPPWLEAVDDG